MILISFIQIKLFSWSVKDFFQWFDATSIKSQKQPYGIFFYFYFFIKQPYGINYGFSMNCTRYVIKNTYSLPKMHVWVWNVNFITKCDPSSSDYNVISYYCMGTKSIGAVRIFSDVRTYSLRMNYMHVPCQVQYCCQPNYYL